MNDPTQLEIKIPCNSVTTNDIARILLNIRTWLEIDCPEPILYHNTHNLDTGITITQYWNIMDSAVSQGGINMFKVCPPHIKLNVSRWHRNIIQLVHITIDNTNNDKTDNDNTNNDNNNNNITVAKVYQKQYVIAHNITTRRQYNVDDAGGKFIGNTIQSYHKQRYLSWVFNNLDVHKTTGGLYGCYIEIREYLPPIGIDRRISLINNKKVFNIILYVPVNSKKDADDKIIMFNTNEQLQQLLHRLCYICKPLHT